MITVNESFHTKANGQVIQPIPKVFVSFPKTINGAGWFTLNSSQLNGTDILSSKDANPMQFWNQYDYTDYTDRLVSVDVERSIEFPYGTQAAMADFTFDNYDKYFTPGSGSTIDDDNLPGRPCRVYGGFNGEGVVSQFVGVTQKMPDINEEKATATYHADDFLTEIAKQTLNKIVVMRNARTDQVLAKIVEQFGLNQSQYSFENGKNVIPFVFFNKGQNAGEAIQQLIQAENGKFWLDEMGILRFSPRSRGPSVPSRTLDDYSLISFTPKGFSNIINHIVISCDLREVQEFQTVYTKTPSGESVNTNWVVGPNSKITRSVKLEDPCYSIVTPTLGRASSVSWFTAIKSDMSNVPSGITVVGAMSTNDYTMTFTNTNNFPVEINEMALWGEPAKVYDHLDYDSYEDVSVTKYGDHTMTIADNPFFQSYDQAVLFSDSILEERAFYNSAFEVQIKGDFSFQIGDSFDVSGGDHAGTYQIDAITWQLENGYFETVYQVHSVPHHEYLILDQSRLDDIYVLG